MSRLCKSLAFLATFWLCTGVFAATAQTTQAQSTDAVTTASDTNLKELVTPPSQSQRYLFVYVCDSAAPGCSEDMQEFSMTALLAEGGWLAGVHHMHDSRFVTFDSFDTKLVAEMTKLCANRIDGLCKAYPEVRALGRLPLLVKIDLSNGRTEIDHPGMPTADQSERSSRVRAAIRRFLRP